MGQESSPQGPWELRRAEWRRMLRWGGGPHPRSMIELPGVVGGKSVMSGGPQLLLLLDTVGTLRWERVDESGVRVGGTESSILPAAEWLCYPGPRCEAITIAT